MFRNERLDKQLNCYSKCFCFFSQQRYAIYLKIPKMVNVFYGFYFVWKYKGFRFVVFLGDCNKILGLNL